MPATPWTPVVKLIKNRDDVSAETVNPPLSQLAARTQHLFEKFEELEDKSVLIAFDQIVAGQYVQQFSVVFYDPTKGGLELTKPSIVAGTSASLLKASNSSYVCGIVKDEVPGSGVKKVGIWLSGLVEYENILLEVLDSSELNSGVNSGPLFLSSIENGKLTFNPGGMAIYVGYARDNNAIYLNPSLESLNEFYFNFRFPLLDRPAGIPSKDLSDIWTVGGDTGTTLNTEISNTVGWMPASLVDSDKLPVESFAQGSLFYYNLPSDEQIDLDTGLTPEEKRVSKELRKSLPPSPVGFSWLTVNGVIQMLRTDVDTDGIYFINDHGIWWYSNKDSQPWSPDINDSLRYKVESGGLISLRDDSDVLIPCPYVVGQKIRFSGSHPDIANNTTYYVASVANNKFQISATDGGSAITSLTTGFNTAWRVQWNPSGWKASKVRLTNRARMTLMFVKINPDYRFSMVTSLKPYKSVDNDSSKAIEFRSAQSPDAQASVGDLLLKFKVPVESVTEDPVTELAVKNLVYDEATGSLLTEKGTVVTSIAGINGIKVTKNTKGAHVISFAPYSVNTIVHNIEPENARLEFIGLNSCLTFDYERLPCGLVGKILLPPETLNQDLKLDILMMGRKPSASNNYRINFLFEYNVMAPNTTPVSTSINSSTTFFTNLASASPFYTANVPFKLTDTSLTIPASALIPGGILNFRLQRPKLTGEVNLYNGAVSILAISWSL